MERVLPLNSSFQRVSPWIQRIMFMWLIMGTNSFEKYSNRCRKGKMRLAVSPISGGWDGASEKMQIDLVCVETAFSLKKI
jgi:hypothetical protein